MAILPTPSATRRRLAWLPMIAMAALWLSFSLHHAAASEINSAQIYCALEAASLNFGHLHLRQRAATVGVGAIVVVCRNYSKISYRIDVTLAFPTMGQQKALLRAKQGTLPVAFYHDAQFVERWGDDRNGASASHIVVELTPGEQRRLRVPVYSLLQTSHDTPAGSYYGQIPVTLLAGVPH
ncbi:Spore coat protein U-like protein [Gammaproteobacteria bacterium]